MAPHRIAMTVTFLEMTAKPAALPPPSPRGRHAVMRCEMPPPHFYRYLYDQIGDKYFWVDRRKINAEQLAEIIHAPDNHLYVLYADGNPAGMAEIEVKGATANIAYFGLMPEFQGRHLGFYFLYHACMNAWAQPITRLTVNTCTLDHPRALSLYQRIGFTAISREERYVELLEGQQPPA